MSRRYFTAMKRVLTIAALLAGLSGMVLSSTLAQAQTTPKLLGTHNAWEAYTYKEGDNTVCFMLSRPTKSAAYRSGKRVNNVKRGEIYVLVTHRPAQNSRNVVSINVGYPFEKGSNVSIQVDKNKSYQMFTADEKALKEGAANDTAWARDDTDQALVKAMRAGNTMRVIGTSRRGTETRDTYSLSGFTAAHQAISGACK
jgi:invasion protein IalB